MEAQLCAPTSEHELIMSPSGFSGVAQRTIGRSQSWAATGARRPSPMVVCSARSTSLPRSRQAASAFRSDGSSATLSGTSWISKGIEARQLLTL